MDYCDSDNSAITMFDKEIEQDDQSARRNQEISGENHDLSEDSIAMQFAVTHQDFRWVQQWGCWLEWDGTVWLHDEKLSVYTQIRIYLRGICQSVEKKHVKQLKKATTITAIERLARSDNQLVAVTSQWDQYPFMLNTDGGIVNLMNGTISDHDPNVYLTKKVPYTPGGKCDRWLTFLDEVTNGDGELAAFLQRVIGYCLTGTIREHALFFFYGTGRNGKGVFLNTIVEMLADYAGVASVDALMENRGDRHPTELASLKGKRFVIAQEVDEGVKWAEARIKMLTGGDLITARYMRQDFFTFEPQFKLLIAGNHKPSFQSIDEALRSRLHLIPFVVTIPIDKRDPDLQEKLKEEMGGILQWAIDGSVEYQRQGLNPPSSVKAATDKYFEDQDTFSLWIEECCNTGASKYDTPTRLFESWKKYALAANINIGTNKEFKQRLEKNGFQQGNSSAKGGRHYMGIEIKLPDINAYGEPDIGQGDDDC